MATCSNKMKYYLVGDGHGFAHGLYDGHLAFTVCYGNGGLKPLHEILFHRLEDLKNGDFSIANLVRTVERTVLEYDHRLYEEGLKRNFGHFGGMCLTMLIVIPDQFVIVANLGDCKLTLFETEKDDVERFKIVFDTTDHSPENPEESIRIEASGGRITEGRVNGTLAVSRSLGDWEYKKNKLYHGPGELVIAKPDVVVMEIGGSEKQISCLMSSDGAYAPGTTTQRVIQSLMMIKKRNEFFPNLCIKLLEFYRGRTSDDMTFLYVENINASD